MPAEKLTQGAAKLFVGAAGATLPAAPANASALADLVADLVAGGVAGFTYHGDTTAALTITDTATTATATSQQASRVLAEAVTQVDTVIATTMRGMDAARLAQWQRGQITTSGSLSVVRPGVRGLITPFPVIVVGGDVSGRQVVHIIEKAGFPGSLTQTYDANDFVSVPVELRVYEGDALPEGYVTYIADPAVAPTPED